MNVGGVDFGYSSSTTDLYIEEKDRERNLVKIILGREYDKKTFSFVGNAIFNLNTTIPDLIWFGDGANSGAVNEVKSIYRERTD